MPAINTMTLTEYMDAVNALGRANADVLNDEWRRGLRLFGAEHHDYPESMMDWYYRRRLTPAQAYAEIMKGD